MHGGADKESAYSQLNIELSEDWLLHAERILALLGRLHAIDSNMKWLACSLIIERCQNRGVSLELVRPITCL